MKPKIPDYGPFKLKFANLNYAVGNDEMNELLKPFDVVKIGGIDGVEGHRGTVMVEFGDRDSLVRALELNNTQFMDFNIRVLIPERRGGYDRGGPRRDGPDDGKDRDFDNWERRGPLSPSEGRPSRAPERDFDWNDRRGPLSPSEGEDSFGGRGPRGPPKNRDDRNYDSWERRGPPPSREESEFGHSGFGGPKRAPQDDDRDYNNWEHRGPPPSDDKKEFGRGGPHRGPLRNSSAERDFDNWERRGPPPSNEHRHGNRRTSIKHDDEKHEVFEQDWNANKPNSGVKVPDYQKHPRNTNHKNTHFDNKEGFNDSTESAAAAASTSPRPHKRLNLLPRSEKAAEVVVPRNAALFGAAKPVDTASKLLEIEEREEKAKQERAAKRAAAEEAAAAAQASQAKSRSEADEAAKSFAALKLQDEEEKDQDDQKAKALEEYKLRMKEELTEAERIKNQEASPEELEGDGWNVVTPKRGGRR